MSGYRASYISANICKFGITAQVRSRDPGCFQIAMFAEVHRGSLTRRPRGDHEAIDLVPRNFLDQKRPEPKVSPARKFTKWRPNLCLRSVEGMYRSTRDRDSPDSPVKRGPNMPRSTDKSVMDQKWAPVRCPSYIVSRDYAICCLKCPRYLISEIYGFWYQKFGRFTLSSDSVQVPVPSSLD